MWSVVGGREGDRKRERERELLFTLSSRLHRPLPVFCIRYRICPRPGHRPESVYIYIYIFPGAKAESSFSDGVRKKKEKKKRILLENNYSTFGLWETTPRFIAVKYRDPRPPPFYMDGSFLPTPSIDDLSRLIYRESPRGWDPSFVRGPCWSVGNRSLYSFLFYFRRLLFLIFSIDKKETRDLYRDPSKNIFQN